MTAGPGLVTSSPLIFFFVINSRFAIQIQSVKMEIGKLLTEVTFLAKRGNHYFVLKQIYPIEPKNAGPV